MRRWVLSFLTVQFLLNLGNAQAALYDRGGGFVYDSDQNITWLQDPSVAIPAAMYFDNASWRIEQFVYVDPLRNTVWDDWRMPKTSELLYLYYQYGVRGTGSLFMNIQAGYPLVPSSSYWGISYLENWNPPLPYSARMDFNTGTSNPLAPNAAQLYAWAVRNNDVGTFTTPIPEPATYAMMLAGFGLLGIAHRRRMAKGQ